MAALRPSLEAPVLIGVGAAFDFHAGLVPQAPPWLQRAGLEWAYRLAHEPRRLWRRYLRYNPRFVGAFARQLAEHRCKRREVLNPPPVRLPGRDLKELLGDAVPHDHARQTLADRYIEREIGRREGQPWRVLDLGCGTGSSVDVFRARDPDVEWVGIDVPGSPEAQFRTRTDARFETFDGVSMPFADGAFELVYCKQVLEHVAIPSRSSPRSAGCSSPVAGSPARPPSSRRITR